MFVYFLGIITIILICTLYFSYRENFQTNIIDANKIDDEKGALLKTIQIIEPFFGNLTMFKKRKYKGNQKYYSYHKQENVIYICDTNTFSIGKSNWIPFIQLKEYAIFNRINDYEIIENSNNTYIIIIDNKFNVISYQPIDNSFSKKDIQIDNDSDNTTNISALSGLTSVANIGTKIITHGNNTLHSFEIQDYQSNKILLKKYKKYTTSPNTSVFNLNNNYYVMEKDISVIYAFSNPNYEYGETTSNSSPPSESTLYKELKLTGSLNETLSNYKDNQLGIAKAVMNEKSIIYSIAMDTNGPLYILGLFPEAFENKLTLLKFTNKDGSNYVLSKKVQIPLKVTYNDLYNITSRYGNISNMIITDNMIVLSANKIRPLLTIFSDSGIEYSPDYNYKQFPPANSVMLNEPSDYNLSSNIMKNINTYLLKTDNNSGVEVKDGSKLYFHLTDSFIVKGLAIRTTNGVYPKIIQIEFPKQDSDIDNDTLGGFDGVEYRTITGDESTKTDIDSDSDDMRHFFGVNNEPPGVDINNFVFYYHFNKPIHTRFIRVSIVQLKKYQDNSDTIGELDGIVQGMLIGNRIIKEKTDEELQTFSQSSIQSQQCSNYDKKQEELNALKRKMNRIQEIQNVDMLTISSIDNSDNFEQMRTNIENIRKDAQEKLQNENISLTDKQNALQLYAQSVDMMSELIKKIKEAKQNKKDITGHLVQTLEQKEYENLKNSKNKYDFIREQLGNMRQQVFNNVINSYNNVHEDYINTYIQGRVNKFEDRLSNMQSHSDLKTKIKTLEDSYASNSMCPSNKKKHELQDINEQLNKDLEYLKYMEHKYRTKNA